MVGCMDVSSDGSVHDNGNEYSVDNSKHEGTSSDESDEAYDPANYDTTLNQDEYNDLEFFYCTL